MSDFWYWLKNHYEFDYVDVLIVGIAILLIGTIVDSLILMSFGGGLLVGIVTSWYRGRGK